VIAGSLDEVTDFFAGDFSTLVSVWTVNAPAKAQPSAAN